LNAFCNISVRTSSHHSIIDAHCHSTTALSKAFLIQNISAIDKLLPFINGASSITSHNVSIHASTAAIDVARLSFCSGVRLANSGLLFTSNKLLL
jgi:hypothetical protein